MGVIFQKVAGQLKILIALNSAFLHPSCQGYSYADCRMHELHLWDYVFTPVKDNSKDTNNYLSLSIKFSYLMQNRP